MSQTPGLREAAKEVARRLTEAGYTAYFAGGCVRDRLMEIEPTDYDVATDARPDAVKKLFRDAQYVGESFGVMLVRRRGHQFHVATFRTEGVYSDGRRPDSVSFSDARHDAERRDFTINGLFEEPETGRLIDYVGGQADRKAKLIRAIGDPPARIREDALRMLRAVRFAARFEFDIETDTAEAIRAAGGDLRGVSRERVGQELKRMLEHHRRAAAVETMQRLGLDGAVLQETARRCGLPTLKGLPGDASYPTALGAWLLDRLEGDEDVVSRGRDWSRALVLSNAEHNALMAALEIYGTLRGPWGGLGVAAQKRLASRAGFDAALDLLEATKPVAARAVRQRVADLAETELAPTPLLGGDDLIAMGLTPGPDFKRVLDTVYDAQLEGAVESKSAALELARALTEAPEGG